MNFNFENLDEEIRTLMRAEVKADIENNTLYFSKRFNENGRRLYPQLLLESIENGNEETLALALDVNKCFKEKESRLKNEKSIQATVPESANHLFVEGEFNRFYMRAIALKAIKLGRNLLIYRARESNKPRVESENLIGKKISAAILLDDLRKNIAPDKDSLLPTGVNSGISVKIL